MGTRASPTIKHLLDWWWRLEGFLDIGCWSRDGGSAVAAQEGKLQGVAFLPCRAKNKGRNLHRELCLWRSICRRAGLAPHLWKFPSTVTAMARGSPVAQDSQSPVLASGVAGLWLWAGWLYSHHFNKEMIKRGWGRGKENPKTSVLLQIREDSFACKECVNHAGLGDVHNPA